uniref:Uncharacterized protein n=1 Tax=Chromera velia CCMP2878 TaxID=1169474 RepID=A0A0G4F186_9ALVE|eukprot:Cvel_14489.t1-p1 / transcript=Cvel_14489.t1 / gene=Cvel_14489 / organism=Chromera_velia_CCMP2878 / gene_product=hypothetical protein / transcript_product=hypothetical protein / location=Cvel_scaffold1033:292-13391(-) / protein_length=1117 / sequence_SO=supercontig / SO=protein_coding / is_pseudo=false
MKAEGSLNLQVPVGAGVAVPTKSSVRPAILENRGPRQRDSQGPSTTAQLQAAAGGAGADRERLDRQGDGDDPTGAANLGPSGSPGRSTGGGGPSAAQLEEELSKGGKQKLSPEEEDRRKERTRAEVDIVPLVDASAMASLRHAFNAGGGRLGCPSFVRAMLESLDLGIDKEQLREYSLERQKQHQRDIFSDLPAFPKPALAALQDEGAEGQEETGERGRGPKGPRFEGDGPDGEGAGAPLNDNAGAFLTQMDTANENPPSIPPSPAPPPISLEAPTSVVALAAFDTNVKGKPSPAGALSVPNPSTGDPLVSPLGSPVIPDASSRGRKGISEGLVSAAGGGREGRPHIPPGSYWLTEEGLGKVATATVEMFEWADCDCDGRLGWEEFSDYLIDAGMAGRQDDVVDKMKRYEQSRVDDLTHHESTIDNAVFLEALDSVAVFHSGAKTFKLYDPHTCTIKKDVSGHRGSAITACHVGSYGQVATSAADMSVCLWSADTMTLRQRIACQDVQMCLQWMGEGGAAGRELLATGATNGIVTLWDLLTLTERKELLQSQENNPPSVNALLLLPDMEVLASALDAGERGGVVQLWDAATCRLAGELGGAKGHQKAVGSLAYSRQFNCLLSAGMDQDAIAWNPYVQRDPIFKLKGHAHALVGVVTVPGTVQIITGGDSEGNVCSRSLKTGAFIREFVPHAVDVSVHQDDPLSDDPRGTVRMEAPTSSDGVGCLAVAPALQLLAAAAGRAVYLFCLRTNRKDKVIDKFLLPKDGVLGGSRGETGAAILSVDFLDEKGILVAGDQSEYKRRERLPEDDVRLTLSPTAVTSVCFVKPKDLTRPPGFMWQQRALQRWRLGYQQPGLGGAMGASTEGAEAELATPMFTIFSAEGVEGDEIDWDSGEEVKTVIPEEGGEKEESSGEEGGQTQAEGEDKGEKASGEAEKEKEGQSDDAKGERGDGQRGVVGATGSLTAPLESPFQVGFLLTGDSSGFIRAWDLSVFFQHYGLEDPFPGGTHVFGEGGGGIDFEEMAWGETGAEGTGEEGNGPTPLGKYRGDSSGQGEGDGMEGAGETKSPDVSPFGRTGTSKIAAGLTMAATSMSLGETALKGSQHKEKQQNKYLRGMFLNRE